MGAGPVSWGGAGAAGILATATSFPFRYLASEAVGYLSPLGGAIVDMDDDTMLDTMNRFSSEGDMVLDAELFDQDSSDIPDPGVLSEKYGEGT